MLVEMIRLDEECTEDVVELLVLHGLCRSTRDLVCKGRLNICTKLFVRLLLSMTTLKTICVENYGETFQGILESALPALQLRSVATLRTSYLMQEEAAFIPTMFPNIAELSISKTMLLVILNLAMNCVHLQKLSLSFTDSDISSLKYNPKLTHFSLNIWSSICDIGLRCIVRCFSNLHILRLDKCKEVTDCGVITIAKHCPNLQEIGFEEGRLITDIAVYALSSCLSLVCCSFLHCRKLTDASVVYFVRRHPLLRRFNISGCSLLSDHTLLALSTHCLSLNSFVGGYCTQITDIGVSAVLARCAKLSSCFLVQCTKLTDRSLLILRGLSTHRSLSVFIKGSPKVSSAVVTIVKAFSSQIRIRVSAT